MTPKRKDYGALSVMEGKCVIFKEMAGIDAFPIVLGTQDTEEIIKTVKTSRRYSAASISKISPRRGVLK